MERAQLRGEVYSRKEISGLPITILPGVRPPRMGHSMGHSENTKTAENLAATHK